MSTPSGYWKTFGLIVLSKLCRPGNNRLSNDLGYAVP
jgi:hypothetical protein